MPGFSSIQNAVMRKIFEELDIGLVISLIVTDSSGTASTADTVTVRCSSDGTNGEIPEFPTVALPVIAVIGLMLPFQRRKAK